MAIISFANLQESRLGERAIPLAGLAVVVLFAVYKLILYPAFLSPMARIPAANPLCHVTPLWIYWVRYQDRENGTIHELHKRLGPIVRTAPNELSVNCYEGGLKTIYTGGFHKTDYYHNRFINYGVDPMFAMSGKPHADRKRMLSHVYSKSFIMANATARACTRAVLFDRLFPILHAAATAHEPLEVLQLLASYSMDSFTTFQFGLRGGSNMLGDVQERRWYLHAFFVRRPWMFWTTELPAFTEWMHRLGIRLVPRWAEQTTYDLEDWQMKLCDRAEAVLAAAEAKMARSGEKRAWGVGPIGSVAADFPHVDVADFPVVFAQERAAFWKRDGAALAAGAPLDPPLAGGAQPYMRRLEIASDMYDHNAAAHETSGDTLTYAFYELSRRPALQKRLRAELLTLADPLVYPRPPAAALADPKAVDQLPLLDAILQETLRLWVAVPGGQPRQTPSPSCSLAGYDNIPGGVRVQSQGYTMHRNAEVFPDPESWRPERWMDQTPEQLALMRRWFWAWGSGGAMCIGSNFAIYSMKYVLAAVYTNYQTYIVDAPDMVLAEGFTAGPRGGKLELQFEYLN